MAIVLLPESYGGNGTKRNYTCTVQPNRNLLTRREFAGRNKSVGFVCKLTLPPCTNGWRIAKNERQALKVKNS